MAGQAAAHWDAAYAQGDDTRSWFEEHPGMSLRMLGSAAEASHTSLDGSVRDQAPGAVEHRLPGRPRRPAQHPPGFLGGVPVAAAERRG